MGSSHTPLRAVSLGFLLKDLMQALFRVSHLIFFAIAYPSYALCWQSHQISEKGLMKFLTTGLLFGFLEDAIYGSGQCHKVMELF